ncbi:Uncharacterized conserved protein (DUF2075) [Streptoalloteichus tenebrarius]|uniref:Uncharacterized conserved protein (DUF2075) n=1 Tax=Streptoalloteichus tenebrarius (strain ATCC 17920 / DSM 40477 / JCM 4838 / CBS 697.72 / NBRC 16177 / NCIMB 11028 / NRRL B-12390 / A12253. 1 / ISP 5477) TaxID=1933 RepID=A0ABT1I0M4_STRSD|nr:Uncharacterized conserved protein (DUF2075) [Streptoalloteichus tenebrarius]BFF03729.1 hypothetical protein GCM10020241_54040 [Streptoalloteichus tenebrarius]
MVLPADVKIGDWARPWNAKEETADAPGSDFWATEERGAGQVGCVYTAQGFEYSWAGVIFGRDLVWRNGQWIPQPRYSHDTSVARKAKPVEFNQLVRNAYKVLLTRGMRGVCLHSVDPETQAFFESLAPPV